MKNTSGYFASVILLYFDIFFLLISPVHAQVIPDTSLPNNSRVTNQGDNSLIEGGTQVSGNLYHSFEKFSIPTGSEAYINNSLEVQNIISRVTGSSISNIYGSIRANGSANLFLINPNGIFFGLGAYLNIGGSFLGSTASSINFPDGTQFNATNPRSNTILSVKVPQGLQFGENPGSINVQGTGHTQFIFGNQVAASITLIGAGESQNGLRLQPGKTFALIGGDVSFNGGVVTAPSGGIEVGSVDSGTVRLIPGVSGWSFNYEGAKNFRNIRFTGQSLLDASGFQFGDIHIQGKNINFTDGSLALIANFGSLSSGAIRVDASETLDMTGITSFNVQPFLGGTRINRGIITSTESGKGADIIISSKRLTVRDSEIIALLTFGTGNSGNLIVNSYESIEILGKADNESSGVSSTLSTVTYGSGQAGKINLSTNKLLIQDGGALQSSTFSDGQGGEINVDVSEVLNISGGHADFVLFAPEAEPIPTFSPSNIASLSISAGNSGNINIKTGQLIVENGAGISASGLKTGNSGYINIDAFKSVDVSGVSSVNPSLNPSKIVSSVGTGDPFISYIYNLKEPPNAVSGNVFINTPSLNVKNSASVTVRNDSTKNAGTLRVNAYSVRLDNKAEVSASTKGGEGGNIIFDSQDLQLRRGSTITTNAGGNGNGGDITINTGTLFARENSDITANAVEGRGGDIVINGIGVFFAPGSEATATSEKGVNGTVVINAPKVGSSKEIIAPSGIQPPEPALDCTARLGDAAEFVDVRTGVIPASPTENLNSFYGWTDEFIPTSTLQFKEIIESTEGELPPKLVEVQEVIDNGDGTISFTKRPSNKVAYTFGADAPCHRSEEFEKSDEQK
ncbi:filamentous hemagglutinin N-terminal domain-containing protein [Nostoc flagelliforme FACHB-838]|uniref:Filamentous hemagglutinin N-terminal domain-containing protein n=1 Tax=Nostoc flagelliforme FACHB-838 TaxID=2692904 RepID=A0ABR8DY75_9NOSO|nr:filamentous hemagglutinin N-terminal domain-containing protein [Nostoc flagelliforme]MBD2534306.1 filamentous hemagglutinin N-terminal domain-containing protein [Nostoc flagelliforme FACHB-838]